VYMCVSMYSLPYLYPEGMSTETPSLCQQKEKKRKFLKARHNTLQHAT